MSKIYPELGGMTRDALLARIRTQVKEKRYQHMLGVEKTAKKLAKQYGANPHQAALAGLLHDYAKELSDKDFFALIDRYALDPDLKRWNVSVWHGMVGVHKIQEDLGLSDLAVLRAIEIHTVGAAQMTTLDKALYVADYIEPGRDFDGVDEARALAARSLDAATAYETARTIEFLAAKHKPIYPQTLATYNAFIGKLKETAK